MMCLKPSHLALCAAFAAMTIAPARAADMHDGGGSMKDMGEPEMGHPIWHGFYVGAHAGYAWGGFNPSDVDPALAVLIDEELEHDPDGGLLGVQVGYNWHRERWVFGIEGDIAASNVEGDLTYDFDFVSIGGTDTFTDSQTFELDFFATLRGRLGMQYGSTLFYVTGGLAWAKVDTTFSATVVGAGPLPDGTVSGDDSVTHTGYTIGGGFETWLRENVSFKAEYLYADLGEEIHQPVAVVPGEPFDLEMHMVRFGLNYHF
jgi:outer membrane immunogenic protein